VWNLPRTTVEARQGTVTTDHTRSGNSRYCGVTLLELLKKFIGIFKKMKKRRGEIRTWPYIVVRVLNYGLLAWARRGPRLNVCIRIRISKFLYDRVPLVVKMLYQFPNMSGCKFVKKVWPKNLPSRQESELSKHHNNNQHIRAQLAIVVSEANAIRRALEKETVIKTMSQNPYVRS
jgi:hypothetical protein